MTTKEAQIALANLKLYISGGGAVDRSTNKAIDMAIKALEKPEPHWIPVTENTPKKYHMVCLVTMNGCLEPYTDKSTWVDGKWYQIEYTTDGYPRKIDITDAVLAWMPLPEPYKGG